MMRFQNESPEYYHVSWQNLSSNDVTHSQCPALQTGSNTRHSSDNLMRNGHDHNNLTQDTLLGHVEWLRSEYAVHDWETDLNTNVCFSHQMLETTFSDDQIRMRSEVISDWFVTILSASAHSSDTDHSTSWSNNTWATTHNCPGTLQHSFIVWLFYHWLMGC